MNEARSCTNSNSISLYEQTNFRLNKINKTKDYCESEIKNREALIKKLNKYITGFDYNDKILIVLSGTFSGGSIFSHLKIKKHTGLYYDNQKQSIINKRDKDELDEIQVYKNNNLFLCIIKWSLLLLIIMQMLEYVL